MNLDAEVERIARRVIAACLPSSVTSPDDWLPHTAWPFPRKRGAALASSGLIAARRDGRTWYARRRDLDAYLLSLPSSAPASTTTPVEPIGSLRDRVREAARRSRKFKDRARLERQSA